MAERGKVCYNQKKGRKVWQFEMERLDKLLANTGRWSRKEARELVKQGRVTVDGAVAARFDDKYPAEAVVMVDGEGLTHSRATYLMLHKPAGVLSATEDKRQKTVLDLLPPHLQRLGLFPVGRLDKDTEGLLLLTDDGALAHELLSPKKHVDKVYFARVEGRIPPSAPAAFEAGLVLEDGLVCQSAGLEILDGGESCLVTLREGKFHQVKRMLAHCGTPVTYLKRLSMGGLCLDETLAPGAWRELSPEEVESLWSKFTKI